MPNLFEQLLTQEPPYFRWLYIPPHPPFSPLFFIRVMCAWCVPDPVLAVSPDHSHPSRKERVRAGDVNESVVCDTTVKSCILKFISCGGVRSLDLDRRPWLDRPWSDEIRDERLGPRPCSSPLPDRTRLGEPWASAWINARWRRMVRGRHGSSSPPAASPRSILSAAGPGLLRLVSALRRRRLHRRPLHNSSSSLHLALTWTPGAGRGERESRPG